MKQGKIDLITLDFPPVVGGISHYLYELARYMPAERMRVAGLSAPLADSFDKAQSFPIVRLGIPTRWSALGWQLKFFAPVFLRYLLQNRDTGCLLCGQAHYSLLLPAWVCHRIRKVPYIVFGYGFDLLHPQTRFYKRGFNYLLKQAETIVVDSEAARKIVLQLGIPENRVVVIYPTVTPSDLQSDQTPALLRERYGLVNKKCILSVGRLVERKGHDMVIRAMPRVLEAVPEAHYLIVGDGAYRNSLQELVNSLQLQEYVTFTGYVPDNELGTCFAMCDLFAMISREIPGKGDLEGFGIVYLEAGLFGKPVVAGASGGVPDAVLHEKTGLLVKPDEPDDVARALVRLLQDEDLAQQLGEAGRLRVLTAFNGRAAARKLLALIDRSGC